MKKFCKFLFTAASFCLLISCSHGGGGGGDPTKLPTPEFSINDDENGITWEANEHCLGYSITVNGEALDPVEDPGYLFSTEAGTYTVKVVALADVDYKDSAAATFSYTTAGEPELGNITQEGNVVTVSSYSGARLEYKVGNGEYQALEGMSVTMTENNAYTFRSASGFNSDTKTYYPGADKVKGVVYCQPGTREEILLEDGSEKNNGLLTEKYSPGVEKDTGSTWEAANQAALVLDTENEGFTSSKCIKMTVTKQGYAFRIKTAFSADGSYDTISFANKMSHTDETFNLNFEITQSLVVGGFDLNGYSFYYKVSEPTKTWSKYTVSLDDPNWYVQGGVVGNQPFSTVKTLLNSFGYQINSVKDMLPHIGSFMIRLKAASADYVTTHAWFDDIKLTNEHAVGTTVEPIVEQIKIYDNYSLESANFSGKMTASSGNIALDLNVGGNPVAIEGTIQQTAEGKLHAVSTTAPAGFDFDAIFATDDSGRTLTLESATGGAATALQGLVCHCYTILDDFESYEEKGIGYDYQHGQEERTGMRGNYYADYYKGTAGDHKSDIGDSNWSLMESDTYSDLEKSQAASGTQSGKLKYRQWGACRYVNWDLFSGEAKAFYGTKFSMMVKGSASSSVSFKIRVFSAPQITASNHTSDSVSKVQEFEIAQDADWTECVVNLDPTVRYFGFSITSVNNKGTDTYYYVDNICAYSHVNPFSI